MTRRRFVNWLTLATVGCARSSAAEEGADGASGAGPSREASALSRTLGGKQFWADELFVHQWHIQRNVLTGHCRLLDGRQRRHASGTFESCRAELEKIGRAEQWPAMSGRAVIVLHGLVRSAESMRGLADDLRAADFSVFNVAYPTTRAPIAEHAKRLAGIVAGLEGIEEINFVAHSLGNLVVRHYLADATDAEAGRAPDGRIRRIVMLGPPNNGARIAEVLGNNRLFELVLGPSATQIRDWADVQARLAIPACEFGIIAGGRGGPQGYNPVLPGDNDLIVSVESTRLVGAADFAVLPVMHTFMMDDPQVRRYTRNFLADGSFISPDKLQPIVKEASDEIQVDLGVAEEAAGGDTTPE